MFKQFDTHYTESYAEVALDLYLERCKLRHALAFCQFRKILPKAKLGDLKEMFEDRKDYMQRIMVKVDNLNKMVKKGEKVP